jgi:hypothetical protein
VTLDSGASRLALLLCSALCSSAALAETSTTSGSLEDRVRALERANDELRLEIESIKEDAGATEARVEALMPLTGRLTGYIDVGFFYVRGDGSGIRTDIGNAILPEYAGVVPDSWVFVGDPLSTAINSRGEPPETAESRAVTFDAIDNGGKASFILNAMSLQIFAGIGESLTVNGIVDLVPRGRDVSDPDGLSLGDFVDLKLAYAEYIVPIESFDLHFYVGKFDSVLGIEYRVQESIDRAGVAPSLICRYTCGRPIGLKARGRFFSNALVLNLAVTNGSSFTEIFPFYDETDSNHAKTGAARLSYEIPLGSGLEIGASGAVGAQDLQLDDGTLQWQFGFDLRLEWAGFELRAEFVKGKAEGRSEEGQAPCGLAPCLRFQGAYGAIGYRVLNWLMPYARVDWRDALHQSGASFVYVSNLVRITLGLHFEVGTSAILKVEYTVNRELGRIPEFPNDVLTSAVVLKF